MISPYMELDGFQRVPISPHEESDGFQRVPILHSIVLIDRQKASGSCRGAPVANPLFVWLKRESKTVSRHDLELGMTPRKGIFQISIGMFDWWRVALLSVRGGRKTEHRTIGEAGGVSVSN